MKTKQKPKSKKCKTCSEQFVYFNSLQKVCSVTCSLTYVRNENKKEYDKESRRRKKDYRDNDLKIRKKAAKEACHAYIRERDKNNPCICCGRPLGLKFDAGHFLESGNNSILRYHEDNIHGQSVYCNQYKGGDSDDYQGRLRLKIGGERVDYLLSNKGGAVKRTVEDYKEIEASFKNKLKELTVKLD